MHHLQSGSSRTEEATLSTTAFLFLQLREDSLQRTAYKGTLSRNIPTRQRIPAHSSIMVLRSLTRSLAVLAVVHGVAQGFTVNVVNRCEKSIDLAQVDPSGVKMETIAPGGTTSRNFAPGSGSHVLKAGMGAQATCMSDAFVCILQGAGFVGRILTEALPFCSQQWPSSRAKAARRGTTSVSSPLVQRAAYVQRCS